MFYKGSAISGSGGGSGGNVDWGDIGGTLSDQTDLANALAEKQDTLTAGTGIDITNDVISATISGLQNTATGNGSLTILGTATGAANATNIGATSSVTGNYSTAIGCGAGVVANATRAIQIGEGTNDTSNTFSVGFGTNNYRLLDGSTGKIPNDRLSAFTGATSQASGTVGGVPAPTTSDLGKFLSADGTWATAGGSVSFDGSTINENASNELQALGVKEARTDTAIRFWHGSQAQYNNGESQTYYNWETGGIAFTETSFLSMLSWTGLAYGNGIFVATGKNSDKLEYSSDGSTWSESTMPNSRDWRKVIYGSKFVAIANNSKYIAHSTDGTTWTEVTLGSTQRWTDIAYGNGSYVVVSGEQAWTSTAALYSTDGETWNTATLPTARKWTCVVYGDGKFIAFAEGSKYIATSTDGGETWAETESLANAGNWTSAIYANGKFIVISSGTNIAYSSDGTTWSEVTLPNMLRAFNATLLATDGTYIVAAGSSKTIYSTDGLTWNESSAASGQAIVYGNNKFVFTPIANNSLTAHTATISNIVHVYTDTDTPTTASTVYSEPDVSSALTITAVGTGTIDVSDGNTYTYNSSGNQTVTYTVGDVHPNYVCNIDGVGLKIGDTLIADATGNVLPTQTGNSGKFLTTDGTDASWATVDALPSQTGNSGKFLTTNGTTASWATVSGGGLQNTATGNGSLTILGTATGAANATNIGATSSVTGNYSTAIGCGAGVVANATRAIQIGEGTNDTSNTFSVGFGTNNYRLLDGSTGKIPNDRIDGATGSFTSQDGKTVTVTNGVITSIV